ncbi:MAG: DEAD/DEAH box helicase family protein [Clostridia bacterium]|nr:DEAD/DEAH box helicase family protein [Clostridia bacterium]
MALALDAHTEYAPTNVMTGGDNQSKYLYYQLMMSMKQAEGIDILVSFLMESGVRMIVDELKSALDRGAAVRILTGNYLGITQPSALYLLKKELGKRVDLRFYNEKDVSFHAKAYIFHYKNMSEMYVGSSNLSRSALTSGIEWNYKINSLSNSNDYNQFYSTFEDLFCHHSIIIDDAELKRYSENWHSPALAKDLARYDSKNLEDQPKVISIFQPRGAQIEALCALENSRAEGATKGLVQAATGVGKTYLAAFDSAPYETVLFVAHREEILTQAAKSFRNVRQSDDYGFFTGKIKDTGKSVIFASVGTLGQKKYLSEQYFTPDYFQYVVIDEFHHAVNDQYLRIVNYFKPKFLLGLTATPDRMDGRNIYEICDYNVPYEISLKTAINKGMLVPFHYYGIYDETDYSGIHYVRGHYDEQELTEMYRSNALRYEVIYKHYLKYHSKRALGFCCSRAHAEEMAKQFSSRGIPSVAVYSNADGEFSEDRDKAVQALKDGTIRVIFSVDMFNEGLDIEAVDMVMFLRPTESPVVFLQQLGRGLRLCPGKEYLNVLDFIGNYEMAGRTRFLLSGDNEDPKRAGGRKPGEPGRMEYPDDCIVDFDMRLIDLFREMDKNSRTLKESIRLEYYNVKSKIGGRVPTRMELFTYMDDDVYQLCVSHPKENPFRAYLVYLHELNELSDEEEELYNGIGKDFISVMETTDMVKVYKIPILYSFYNHGDIRMAVTDDEVVCAWKEFFSTGTNWKDIDKVTSHKKYLAMTDKQHLSKAKFMPIHFLLQSGKGFFVEKDGYALALRDELARCIQNEALKSHMKDILEYRTMEYYRRRYQDNR